MPPQDTARLEAAVEWHLRLQDDPRSSADPAYVAWSADPFNKAAMDEIAETWQAVDAHAATPSLVALSARALSRAHASAHPRRFSLTTLVRAVAATVVLVVGLAGAAYIFRDTSINYVTAIGERRVVMLDDGTRLTLDADTDVTAQYTRKMRTLTLHRGRARFDVSHERRVFVVKADNETILAVGTQFDVERLNQKVVVTLLDGQVIVSADPAAELSAKAMREEPRSYKTAKLKPGDQLVAVPGAPFSVSPVNVEMAASWEQSWLTFRDEPLSDVVARVNRYTSTPIHLDPSVEALRISGGFRAGDAMAFVDAVTAYLPVDMVARDNGLLLRAR